MANSTFSLNTYTKFIGYALLKENRLHTAVKAQVEEGRGGERVELGGGGGEAKLCIVALRCHGQVRFCSSPACCQSLALEILSIVPPPATAGQHLLEPVTSPTNPVHYVAIVLMLLARSEICS